MQAAQEAFLNALRARDCHPDLAMVAIVLDPKGDGCDTMLMSSFNISDESLLEVLAEAPQAVHNTIACGGSEPFAPAPAPAPKGMPS